MPYFDQSGVLISDADLPQAFRERTTADRSDTIEQINLLQSDIEGPQNCQQHDAD